jgi:hypothetical protein
MTINLGKRNPGLLTAASPGDTLYIPLAFFNDSGASISIGSTLAAGDIEVFKNGSVTQRATDSGYAVLGDTGNFDNRIGLKMVSISLFNTADDASFYAVGSSYQVAIDSVTVDGRTVRFWPAIFEVGEPRANIVQVSGDTGAADVLRKFAATNGTLSPAGELDTGSVTDGSAIAANVLRVDSDTGAADRLGKFAGLQLKTDGTLDTGTGQTTNTLNITATATTDTGQVANAVWNSLRSQHTVSGSFGESDTGINQRLGQIQSDVDTGLRTHINDLDTGLHDLLSDYDTGVRGLFALQDTGAVANAVWGFASRGITAISDTGLNDNLGRIRADVDTGLRVHIDDLDTGLHAHISDVDTGIHSVLQTTGVLVAALSDTGVNQRFAQIQSDVDTGLRTHINDLDTGLHDTLADYDTGVRGRLSAIQAKTDSLTFTVAGIVDSNIEYVNATQITGTGDTGTGNTWRPA